MNDEEETAVSDEETAARPWVDDEHCHEEETLRDNYEFTNHDVPPSKN